MKLTSNSLRKTELPIVYLTVFLLIIFTYFLFGYAPFGKWSLAYDDGYYQYMDFFAYYKDVLEGRQSLWFSLSNGLGAANLPLFLYYLASPFNLLVVFFDKTDLHSFFDLVIALKLSMAATTMFWYLQKRFGGSLKVHISYGLALSYAFMQYSFSQATNSMWLDGVYMLPIILYGIYTLIEHGNGVFLTISVGIAILLNWYSAGINCVFTFVWVLLEIFLRRENSLKESIGSLLKYFMYMALGVAMASFVFIPNVIYMLDTPRNSFDVSSVIPGMRGNFLTCISGYSIGGMSSEDTLSLFAGALVLIGVLGFFLAKEIELKKRLVTLGLLFVTLMSFFFKPLYFIFSLFQNAYSYYYRHAYVCIFFLIFIAAYYFSLNVESDILSLCLGNIVYGIVFTIVCLTLKTTAINLMIITLVIHFAILGIVILWKRNTTGTVVIYIGLAILTFEMIFNAKILLEKYHSLEEVATFAAYEKENGELIEAVREYDSATDYRMTQTTTRSKGLSDTANLNEPMAFGYWGIESYTSMPDADQMDFLKKAGYRVYHERIVEKTMPLLAVDSLLGVKYILSPYEIGDLQQIHTVSSGEKKAYYNQYNMPMAFLIHENKGFNSDKKDAVKYQNKLFKYISGDEEALYEEAAYEESIVDDIKHYDIAIPEGHYMLYGYIKHKNKAYSNITLNGDMGISYGTIHSLDYFYIPLHEGETSAYIDVSTDNPAAYKKPKFYLLDLDKLQKISETANENVPKDLIVTNSGKVSCTIDAKDGDSLFTSIPYVRGMKVKVNGEKTEPVLIQNCLMTVPLKEGKNEVLIKYSIPYFGFGMVISLLSLLATGYLTFRQKNDIKKLRS